MHCYDTIADKVSTNVTNIPERFPNCTVAATTNRLYFMGLSRMLRPVATVYVFDIDTQSWSQAPPLPKPIAAGAATTVLDRWIIYAGDYFLDEREKRKEDNFDIYIFDTFTQQWSESTVELEYGGACRCITFGSHIIIFFAGLKLEAINIKHIIPDWTYERIKHFILMRELVDKGQATPIIPNKKQKIDTSDQIYVDNDRVIQELITNVSLDVFRNILSFLIYSKSELHTWSNNDWRNTLLTKVVVKDYYSYSEEGEYDTDLGLF